MNEIEYDWKLCWQLSRNNKEDIKEGGMAGCYYCLDIFHVSRIWSFYYEATAICPNCLNATVVSERVMEINIDNLRSLSHWEENR